MSYTKGKLTIILLFVITIVSFNNTDRTKCKFENTYVKCSYETYEGRIDGKYISHYKNGKKKAEGIFENNYRTGLWTVWDSTGKLRAERLYENPFCFKSISPKAPDDKPIELLNIPRYSIQYNKDGYIDNFQLEERMVVWSKRLWRVLSSKDNPILFEKNKLFNILVKNILNKNITAFSTKDDQYTTEISPSEIDTNSINIISYKLKEDSFFDNERLVFETRIIGICPVAINLKTKDTLDLFWIYYPEAQRCFAQEKIQLNCLPQKIKTLDDLFFYRFFFGQIYKESNIYDRKIADYKNGNAIKEEAERIEIGLIESEHDIWINFSK